MILEAFLPIWKDFAAQKIRLDDTLSKVDKLVQLAETKNEEKSEEKMILNFFKKDIEVNKILI